MTSFKDCAVALKIYFRREAFWRTLKISRIVYNRGEEKNTFNYYYEIGTPNNSLRLATSNRHILDLCGDI